MRPWALAVAALLLAGCTEGGTTATEGAILAPATTGHVLLRLDASGDPQQIALHVEEDGGLDVRLPERLHRNDTGAAGWLGIGVPTDASGLREVVVAVTGAVQDRVVVSVEVDEGGEGLAEGATALVDVVLRTANGTIALNSRADVASSPLPRSQGFEEPQEHAPMPLSLSPQALPPELLEPLAAMAVGQSRTIALPDFYGPAKQVDEQPREEDIPRRQEVDRFHTMGRDVAQQQRIIDASTREGDRIDVGGLTYLVGTLNASTLRLELDAEVGDEVTFYDAWPQATVVTSRDAQQVVFRTDPPEDAGAFTWRPEWPGATQVVALNDSVITLRHSPDVGHTYQVQTPQGAVGARVTAVEADHVTVEQDNPHPLAGATIYLEATLVGEETQTQP